MVLQSRVKVVAILCFWVHTIGRSFSGGRSDCGCAYEICSDLLNHFRGFCGSNPCISVGFLDDHTSARFKSYQFLKVVSGGRAPGKSSSFASSQLLVLERFHCFRAVRLEKVQFLVSRWFLKLIFVHSFKGANAGCCLLAACLLMLASSWIRGRSGGRSGVVRGVVRLYFQHLFSFVFFVCSFFFIFFSFFLTDCYFFSFHCFLRSLSRTPSQIKPLWQNDCL